MFAQNKLFRLPVLSLGAGLVFISSGLTGCSDSVLWGGESQLSGTETGVAAGAAIGAGLGAFIGSTAGGAGEGMVVGALAGGVTGGLVGREIDLEEGVKGERSVSTRQQGEMLQEHRREQNQLRRKGSDLASNRSFDPPASNLSYGGEDTGRPRAQMGRSFNFEEEGTRSASSASRATGVRYGKKTYLNAPSRPNSQARPFVDDGSPISREAAYRHASGAESSPRTGTFSHTTTRTASVEKTERGKGAVTTTRSASVRTEQRAGVETLPEKLNTEKKELAATEHLTKEAVSKEPLANEGVLTKDELPPAKAVKAEVAKAATPASEQCVDAQEEASRAQTASSDADRLFYLTRAIRLCPQSSDYHTQVGKVYQKIGRQQDAEFEFRQALDLDANNTEAASFLGKKKPAATADAVAPKNGVEETAALDTEESEELPEGEQ